jgi:putative addiction module CopG family antidote
MAARFCNDEELVGMQDLYPPDIQQFVQEAVATGEFASEEDVVVTAVRTLRELKNRQQTLKNDIQAAIDEIEQGQGEVWDVAELDRQLVNRALPD